MDSFLIHKQLKRNFVVAVAITLFHVVLGYIIATSRYIEIPQESAVTVKMVILLFVLVSIPLNLKWFSSQLKKLATYTDAKRQAKDYIKYSRIRVFIILMGLISAIMFFFIRQMYDMLYVIGIECVILLLCVPTKSRVDQEMSQFLSPIEENQNIDESNNFS